MAMGLSVSAVRYACLILACVVGSVAACVSPILSHFLFGNYQHTPDLLVLVVSLIFSQMAAAEQTILRGLGHVAILAKINVIALSVGGALTIPFIYFWGLRGVAPSMLAASMAMYWFSRRASSNLQLHLDGHSRESIVGKARSLVKVGMIFFGLGIIGMLLSLCLSVIVRRQEGIEGNGIYQAAVALTVTIASFVLSAMGQDFFPKIVHLLGKGLKDEVAAYCTDQIEMALLMALPILAAVSFFSHELIQLTYTGDFHAADPLVGVMAASCWARICYWPHMLCMLAEANAFKVLLSELVFALAVGMMSWLALPVFGVAGAACAYAACFLVYSVAVSWIVARMTGHLPIRQVWGLYFTGLICIMVGYYCHPAARIALLLVISGYVIRRLVVRMGPQHRLTRLISRLPLIKCLVPANPS